MAQQSKQASKVKTADVSIKKTEEKDIPVVIEEKDEPVVTEEVQVVEKKPKETKKKTICRVILATPTYYVIRKDGKSITINKKNDYRRGDEILF